MVACAPLGRRRKPSCIKIAELIRHIVVAGDDQTADAALESMLNRELGPTAITVRRYVEGSNVAAEMHIVLPLLC